MNFETSRSAALQKLESFIDKEIFKYNFKRNFDLGRNDKSNISCLSPYISHRLITEYEIIKSVLAKEANCFSPTDKESGNFRSLSFKFKLLTMKSLLTDCELIFFIFDFSSANFKFSITFNFSINLPS